MPRISCQPQRSLRQKKKNCCSSNCLRVIYLSQLHKRTWGPARTKHKSPAYCENPMLLMLRSWLIKCSCLSSFSVMLGFFFFFYLHRCPWHQCRQFPWTCRSQRPSSPAGIRSTSHCYPECTYHFHCTTQGSLLRDNIAKKEQEYYWGLIKAFHRVTSTITDVQYEKKYENTDIRNNYGPFFNYIYCNYMITANLIYRKTSNRMELQA